jgi:hypothetical protein
MSAPKLPLPKKRLHTPQQLRNLRKTPQRKKRNTILLQIKHSPQKTRTA